MIISLITAPVEPAPIEPEVETFKDTAEVTEVKTEGTFYTNKLYSHQLQLLIMFTNIAVIHCLKGFINTLIFNSNSLQLCELHYLHQFNMLLLTR